MTDKEKAIVMAYTGRCMLTGDKFQIFHKYVEDIMGRPIMTHEIVWLEDTIKEKAKADFIALCAEQEPKTGHWINIGLEGKIVEQIVQSFTCSECGAISVFRITGGKIVNGDLCPNCGARMFDPQESDRTCHTCKHYLSGERDGSCGSYICKEYSNWESENEE